MAESNPQISHKWLEWARKIQALAQSGKTFAVNEWQIERYEQLMSIAAEMVIQHTNLSHENVLENFMIQPGYATPKIDVRGAVFRDGKLLMVKEIRDGGWTMPGGWADVGDYPSAAAEREVWEESGFEVKARKLIGVYDANRNQPMEFYHAYKLVFLCEVIGGEPKSSNETDAVEFYALDEVPENFAGERTRPRHIRDAFAALADPDTPTVFD